MKIIVAGLIDDLLPAVLLGVGVAECDIDLSLFKRRGKAVVVDAYEQSS